MWFLLDLCPSLDCCTVGTIKDKYGDDRAAEEVCESIKDGAELWVLTSLARTKFASWWGLYIMSLAHLRMVPPENALTLH